VVNLTGVCTGEHKFDKTNVLVCEIEKVGCLLTFTFKGFTPESDQLKRISSENQEELIESAKKLQEQGMPYQKIADELGVSKSTVGRWLKP
jgi:transcriptional regulator with PAS, ATPase and Fis domain